MGKFQDRAAEEIISLTHSCVAKFRDCTAACVFLLLQTVKCCRFFLSRTENKRTKPHKRHKKLQHSGAWRSQIITGSILTFSFRIRCNNLGLWCQMWKWFTLGRGEGVEQSLITNDLITITAYREYTGGQCLPMHIAGIAHFPVCYPNSVTLSPSPQLKTPNISGQTKIVKQVNIRVSLDQCLLSHCLLKYLVTNTICLSLCAL